jgi:excisionase family DNA binding protein
MSAHGKRKLGNPTVDNGALCMPTQHNSSNSLLDKIETAELLNISLRTLNNKLKAGAIPHVRLGKLVRFIPSDLERYIQANRIGGGE